MRPRIYKDKAAKQAEYRQAKSLGMTVPEYRAALAAGKITPPLSFDELLDTQVYEGGYVNNGWYGQARDNSTHRWPKTHLPSTSEKHVEGVTVCGKFQDVVQMSTGVGQVPTCVKCRTNSKITPPPTFAEQREAHRLKKSKRLLNARKRWFKSEAAKVTQPVLKEKAVSA